MPQARGEAETRGGLVEGGGVTLARVDCARQQWGLERGPPLDPGRRRVRHRPSPSAPRGDAGTPSPVRRGSGGEKPQHPGLLLLAQRPNLPTSFSGFAAACWARAASLLFPNKPLCAREMICRGTVLAGPQWNLERTPTSCELVRRQARAPAERAAVSDRGWRLSFPRISSSALCVRVLQALSWLRGRLFRTGLLGQSCAAEEFVCSREEPPRNGPPEITVLWGTPPFLGPQPVLFLKLRCHGLNEPKVANQGK